MKHDLVEAADKVLNGEAAGFVEVFKLTVQFRELEVYYGGYRERLESHLRHRLMVEPITDEALVMAE